jgi:hypothetical protein
MRWVALAVFCLAAVACNSSEEITPTPAATDVDTSTPPIVTPCFAGRPGCETPLPVPTGEAVLAGDQLQAKEIALADLVVTGVLGSATFYVRGVGDLIVRDEVIGGVVEIVLDQPLAVDADLPYMDGGHRGGESNPTQIEYPPPYYMDGVTHVTVDDTRSLFVSVDLNRGKVVGVVAAPF